MNKKVKQKWIKALRSGKYKQGRHILRPSKDSFCCLGVLCDLYLKENKKNWNKDLNGEYALLENIDASIDGILPVEVRNWAELPACNPKVLDGKGRVGFLTDFNDGEGILKIGKRSFKQIANYIEKCL